MSVREPVPQEHSQRFIEIAQSARITWHMLRGCGDPATGSPFEMADGLYPLEKVSVRAKSFLGAAHEHLMLWADHVAPFRFHPEQVTNFSLRPTYTLARAALEGSAQAVWLLSTRDPVECIRRHLRLIRWDHAEHRKSRTTQNAKEASKARDALLLQRVAEFFSEDELRPPNGYLHVLQAACKVEDLDLEVARTEYLWRAASGAAHGMYWPNLELNRVTPGEEYEPGHYRTEMLPDPAVMVEVIDAAHKMTQYGTLRYLDYAGADIRAAMNESRRWLAGQITLKDDADPDVLKRLRGD